MVSVRWNTGTVTASIFIKNEFCETLITKCYMYWRILLSQRTKAMLSCMTVWFTYVYELVRDETFVEIALFYYKK